MTGYHLDEKSIGLTALRKRLETSDLIPSQQPLLVELGAKFAALRAAGIKTLADLRGALRSQGSLTALSTESGVDVDYLRLLKRTIKGLFPKPRSLRELDWLGSRTVTRLKAAGITNTQKLFDATSDGTGPLAKEIGIDVAELMELAAISDLCRIQWVSPSFARALMAAGNTSAAAVAKADPEALCHAIEKANRGAKFYKGKVGLRDVRRLVAAAAYVP